MPTYDYRCLHCGREQSVHQSISEYTRAPVRPQCHGEMQRRLSVVPGLAVHNALAGDRHYDGLRATDGTDISTRDKHRRYMRENGLAMDSDYKETWKKAEKEREALRNGTFQDKELRNIITEEVTKAVARSD